MPNCQDHCHKQSNLSVCQTLDELDFERGIWFAAQHGDMDRVDKLLASGTSPNKLDAAGYTALHYAARNGHTSVCSRLIAAGSAVDAATRAGRATPLHRAASAGRGEVVCLLLGSGSDEESVDADGKTALHRAVEGGHADVAKMLLECNPQLKFVKDLKDNTPLDYAGENPTLLDLLV